MSGVANSHDRDAMIAADLRKRKMRAPPPPESDGAAERAARRDAEMARIRAATAPLASGQDFIAAKRAEIDYLEAFANKILEANPRGEDETEEEEAHWRELARTVGQMRPLLEALERAEATEPGYEPYRAGFDLRLVEAMARVTELCSFTRLQPLRQRKTARNPRPKAESPFTRFIKARPRATPTEIKEALEDDARTGVSGDLELSDDGLRIIAIEDPPRDPPRHLKISDIRQAVAKARKRRPEKSTAQK
jgi:hypothetical protein